MGNTQSMPKLNLYITKVSNNDLPLCPFIHTIVSFNSPNPQELDPVLLKKMLAEKDLHLEIMDIRNGDRFKITVPCGTEKLGVTVVKLSKVPNLLNIRVIAVKESSSAPLLAGDQIIGISDCFCEDEDELVYTLKTNMFSQIVVLRDTHVELVEIKSGDLGCEIGLGMLFKPTEMDYKMAGYNGNIKRELEEAGDTKDEKKEARDTKDEKKEARDTKDEKKEAEDTKDENKTVNKDANADVGDSMDQAASFEGSVQPADIAGKFDESCHISSGLCENNNDSSGTQANPTGIPQPESSTPEKSIPPESHGRTASYVYKPPRNFSKKSMPLSQKNHESIFAEAGVPAENQFLQGAGIPEPERAHLLDNGFATQEDFVRRDGEIRLKDGVFEERKEGNNIQELFEDDESRNNEDFEMKINNKVQDI